jgi:hypothetical protein
VSPDWARLILTALTSRGRSLDLHRPPGGCLALGPVGPGLYMLSIERTDASFPFIRVLPHGRSAIFVPALERTAYVLDVRAEPLPIVRLGGGQRAFLRPIRLWDVPSIVRARRDRGLVDLALVETAFLLPLLRGGSKESADLARALRLLFRIGFGVAGARLQTTLARCGRNAPTLRTCANPNLRLGVVLHLFHVELWEEFAACLGVLPSPFELIVTGLDPNDPVAARIRAAYPGVQILAMANRGRDVGPFLELLRQGRLDSLDLVLKLHGKRSAPAGPRALLGEVWRHACLQNLAGSAKLVERIIDRFRSDAGLGMIGPRLLRMPNADVSLDAAWGENRAIAATTARRLDLDFDDRRLDFFAGTMAWIRPRALAALRSASLSLDDFPKEKGQVDGTLQHALERLLAAIATASGMRVEDSDLADVEPKIGAGIGCDDIDE